MLTSTEECIVLKFKFIIPLVGLGLIWIWFSSLKLDWLNEEGRASFAVKILAPLWLE